MAARGAQGRSLEVLLLGAPGSGKTLLVRRIKALCNIRVPDEIADTMQTNGVELDEITYGKSTLKIREVGGAFVEVWNRYYEDCSAWIFVVDVADRVALAEATSELLNVAGHPQMEQKPLFLVYNKCDLPSPIPTWDLQQLMRLNDLKSTLGPQMCQIMHVSALKGTGVLEMLQVICDHAS
eukprot:Tamp_24924.p1 GENE.Tamp_24924~~Tamp_24924.p1  ORF type:complete len:181 (+),score=40.50 Tamp_24924:58-600(+)